MTIAADLARDYRQVRKRLFGRTPPGRKWSRPMVVPIPENRSSPAILRRILREVAIAHNLRPEHLTGPRRDWKHVRARFEFCYRAVTETAASSMQIGDVLQRHHTCVLYGVIRHCRMHDLEIPRGSTFTVRQPTSRRRGAAK